MKYSASQMMPISFSLIINTIVFLPLIFQIHTITANKMDISCGPFNCGNFTNITYPFWSLNTQPNYCGYPEFKLDCQNGSLTMEIKSQKFLILYLNQTSKVLRIARIDLMGYTPLPMPSCPKEYVNVNIDLHFFKYTPSNGNYTVLYECGPLPYPDTSPLSTEVLNVIACKKEDKTYDVYIVSSSKSADFTIMDCKNSIQVPGIYFANNSYFGVSILDEGFEVQWGGVDHDTCDGCRKSGERCGYNTSENAAMCLSKKSTSPTTSNDHNKGMNKKLVGILVGSSLFILIVIILGVSIYRNQRKKLENRGVNQTDNKKIEDIDIPIFDLSTIVNATNNFSNDNKLGQGGFGPVYQGKLKDGQDIAVKRLSNTSGQGQEQFINEVRLIAKLQHKNLVKLLGCCIDRDERHLIYELMTNRSLDCFIFDQTRKYVLGWTRRFNIIGGIARGLHYLHEDSRVRILHRDIKTSNILLDENMDPKISDFGLARALLGDEAAVETNTVVGTRGYMSPEIAGGSFSVKSDVYSFGIIILETISGKKIRTFYKESQNLDLLGYTWKMWFENKLEELFDESLGNSTVEVTGEISRCIQIGLLCIQERPDDRPDMTTAILMLTGDKALPKPKKPAFYPRQSGSPSKTTVLHSNNDVSITSLDGR